MGRKNRPSAISSRLADGSPIDDAAREIIIDTGGLIGKTAWTII